MIVDRVARVLLGIVPILLLLSLLNSVFFKAGLSSHFR
jgi:hypothetical protein